MDIEGAENTVKKVDSLLTTLTKTLKKHWIILCLLAIGAFFYFALTAEEEVYEEQIPTTYIVDQNGDTLYYDQYGLLIQ